MKWPRITLLFLVALGVRCGAVFAQTKPVFKEDVGYLGVRRDTAHWRSPESLLSEVQSKDERTRLNALLLFGLTSKQAHRSVWSQGSPSHIIGEKVVTPDRVTLTYAAFGRDSTQQAVVALEDFEGQLTYAAVAVPSPNGWERVAVFDCWCKYEMYRGQDSLTEFIQLHDAPQRGPTSPQHYELVFRASGGGTGIYTQHEAHYRIMNGQLRRVLSFVSSYRSCPPGGECTINKRWFYPTAIEGASGGVLVSSTGRFTPQRTANDIDFSVAALQNRHLRSATCRTYTWNEQRFEYTRSAAPVPCSR